MPNPYLPPVAADQDGLFSRQQAHEAYTSEGAYERVRRGAGLTRLAPGIHTAVDLTQLDRRQQHLTTARAELMSLGDAWCAARRTSAVLHGLPLLGRAPGTVQLTRSRTSPAARSSSRHRSINRLLPQERTELDGIATTTLARTVFDIARRESSRSALVVADAALRAGMDREELEQVIRAHAGWPGARQARWAARHADGRAESPLESLGRAACLEENLPLFEPQVLLVVDGVVVARLDGLWREQLVAFEGDGALKFDGAGVLPKLLVRQERIREAGIPVVRAGWGDLTRRRRQWAAGVRRELADNPGRPREGVELISTAPRITPLDRSDHYRWPVLSAQHAVPEQSEEPAARRVA